MNLLYTLTRLHAYTLTRLHAYTLTRLHAYTLVELLIRQYNGIIFSFP
jgi:hypothetical protein